MDHKPSLPGSASPAAAPPITSSAEDLSSQTVSSAGKKGGKKKLVRKKKAVKIKIEGATALSPTTRRRAATYRNEDKQMWAALLLQRNFRRRSFVAAVERMLLLNRRRKSVLAEILSTERTYVQCLQQLKRQFLHPLSSLLSEIELTNVFPRVNELWKLQEHLLSRLSTFMSSPLSNFQQICDLFKTFAQNAVSEYSQFSSLSEHGLVVLQKVVEGDPNVAKFFRSVVVPPPDGPKDDRTDAMKLRDGLARLQNLMVTPIQRLPRYELLFKELVKCSENHNDFPALVSALEAIKSVLFRINEHKRASDQKFLRAHLEAHASMEVLRTHTFVEKQIHSLHYCAHCDKSIWGLAQKCAHCHECGAYFHLQCKPEVERLKACMQRKRIDLNAKRLVFHTECYLMPEEENLAKEARIAKEAKASSSKVAAGRSPGLSRLQGESSRSVSKHLRILTSLRGLLLIFADGVGIGYQWIYDDDKNHPTIDIMGELPWKSCEFVRTGEDKDANGKVIHKFEIRSAGATKGAIVWRFYQPFVAEVVDLEKKFKQAQEEGLEEEEEGEENSVNLRDSKAADMRMNLLLKSDRYTQKFSSSMDQPSTPPALRTSASGEWTSKQVGFTVAPK